MAWVPFPLGANRPLPAAVLGVMVALLLLVWCMLALIQRPEVRIPRALLVAAAGIAAVLLWSWLQGYSGTPSTLHHPVWSMLTGTEMEATSRISVNAATAGDAILGLATPVGVFALAYLLGGRQHRAERLLLGTLAIIAFYSALAIVMKIAGWYPYVELEGKPELTSTIVNRNHFATYVNVGLAVTLAWLLPPLFETPGESVSWRAGLVRSLAAPIERHPWISAAAGLLLVALLGTFSRGGFLSLAVALLVLIAGLAIATRVNPRRAAATLAAGLLAMAIVLALVGGPLLDRLDDLGSQTDETAGNRLAAWTRTVELIAERPWTGYGNGTYYDIFMMNNDLRFTAVFDHAHNDYLEIMVELGLPAAMVLLLALTIPALICVNVALERRGERRRSALCAVGVGIVVATHALVDFSLVVPAVAATAALVSGVGCARANA